MQQPSPNTSYGAEVRDRRLEDPHALVTVLWGTFETHLVERSVFPSLRSEMMAELEMLNCQYYSVDDDFWAKANPKDYDIPVYVLVYEHQSERKNHSYKQVESVNEKYMKTLVRSIGDKTLNGWKEAASHVEPDYLFNDRLLEEHIEDSVQQRYAMPYDATDQNHVKRLRFEVEHHKNMLRQFHDEVEEIRASRMTYYNNVTQIEAHQKMDAKWNPSMVPKANLRELRSQHLAQDRGMSTKKPKG